MAKINIKNRCLFVADSVMQQTVEMANRAAKTDVPVLLCGESGTGKEVIARYIHEQSHRKNHQFVSVNCAAIPDGLLEAELFGYERGAFTGANTTRIGKFERAQNGTLLLDEISEMPYVLQAKLLRVLQEGEVDRLGGDRPIPINTRIIATTNRNPLKLIDSDQFREDLFYRLNVIRIDCKPLRGRKEAIRELSQHLVREFAAVQGVSTPAISALAIEVLENYGWPGNIRELQNAVQRALLVAEGRQIEAEHFGHLKEESREPMTGVQSLSEVEREHILKTLKLTNGNRSLAAKKLGISARTLRNKLKIYKSLTA